MKNGDLVSVKGHGFGVVLYVSQKDIRSGTNARLPGFYVFRGYWYGKNPFSINSYGKIEGPANRFKRVGVLRNHWQAKRMIGQY